MYFNNQIKWKYKGIKILFFLVSISKYFIIFMRVITLHYSWSDDQSINYCTKRSFKLTIRNKQYELKINILSRNKFNQTPPLSIS